MYTYMRELGRRGVKRKLPAAVVIVGSVIVATAPAGGAAATVPGPPVVTSVTPGQETILLGFQKPARNGGSAIIDYRATCKPEPGGGKPAIKVWTQSPILVAKVSGGKKYRCTVAAKNRFGFGPESKPSAIVVPTKPPPKGLPDPPPHVTATAISQAIQVRFTPVFNSGGEAVTGYVALCTATDKSHHNKQKGTESYITVDHLLPNKAYTCQVASRNPLGYGEFSKPSNEVTTLPPPTVPGPPTVTSVTPAVHSVSVAFKRSASNGGKPIFAYRATCSSADGGMTGMANGHASPLLVRGLAARTYTCVVQARNVLGLGAPSDPSDEVVPTAS
jgi:hypothetical protein